MPRQSRIDTPGALHHIIGRGMERRKIFRDNQDRHHFPKRLGTLLLETITPSVRDIFNLSAEDLLNPGKHPMRVQARSGLTHGAVTERGLSATEVGLKWAWGNPQPAVQRNAAGKSLCKWEYALVVTLKAGTIVFEELHSCNTFPFILSGTIRVYKQSVNGRELPLYVEARASTPNRVVAATPRNELLGGVT